jgi:hypothetical protein
MESEASAKAKTKGRPPHAFSDALKRLVSVPRAEMQKRIEQAPKESVSRHKRYKYVPAERPNHP